MQLEYFLFFFTKCAIDSCLPDDFGALGRPRDIDGASALDVGVTLVVVLEDEDEVAGGDDPAGAALGGHLVRDGNLVVQPL